MIDNISIASDGMWALAAGSAAFIALILDEEFLGRLFALTI